MLERLVPASRAEKKPWKMFFVGLIYASLSLLLVHWFFSNDAVLSKHAGLMVVTFSVMFSLPFMYNIIKQEEKQDEKVSGFFGVWTAHGDAIQALMWLFFGFIIAFAFWNTILKDPLLFNAQIGTYCLINSPGNIEGCVSLYSPGGSSITGYATKSARFVSILENNLLVMIFTLVFSLLFGAGAIFILAWNASVISAAIGIFARYQLSQIPLGLARYMIHGLPEIGAYFITALAGGIFGVSALRNGMGNKKFLKVTENASILILLAIFLVVLAGIMEVYLTPLLFR
ncbi:MAG TPA: stage II sporulation protein M [Candidatus Pacearchaeota archaeon]|nr:stage II sporulation protein M [Candidatus Pacearchaeota archaeon]